MEKVNQVSIRLIKERPLLSEEQLTSPEKVAMAVGDYIRDIDREVLCVINFNSKLQPINFNLASVGAINYAIASPREILKSAILSIEASMFRSFAELGSKLIPLSGNERLKILHDYYRLGREDEFNFDIRQGRITGTDFRNEICNTRIKYHPDYFEDEGKVGRVLFIKKYPTYLSDRFFTELTFLPVHSVTSVDVVPVPKDLTMKMLQKKYLGIESDIIKQQRTRNRNNDFSSDISYATRQKKKDIEEIMNNVRENDESLYYVSVTMIVMADDKDELESICETVDPMNEYEDVTEKYNGTYINISTNTRNYINPMDMDVCNLDVLDSKGWVRDKCQFMLSICEQIMKEITPQQRSIISRCVKDLYMDIARSREKYVPTMEDLYNRLLEQEDKKPETWHLVLKYLLPEH